MTRARATLVSIEDTPYYHCVGRCVRRAFLCGWDKTTGRSFEHRRDWIRDRLTLLTEVFAIDLCAYAIMSNHYHLVVKLDPSATDAWSPIQIIERWTRLFSGPPVAAKFLNGSALTSTEQTQINDLAQLWRSRLCDLSWFMRCLNEPIARMANAEDQCTGHFWESRFKSQALLDETALLTAMTYVDLNPIRVGMAKEIADSGFTSGQDRLGEITQEHRGTGNKPKLLRFDGTLLNDAPDRIPFNVLDYLDLLDNTGRALAPGKRGAIGADVPKLLTTLGVATDDWLSSVGALQARFELAIGAPHKLKRLAERWGKRWIRGMGQARKLYPEPSG